MLDNNENKEIEVSEKANKTTKPFYSSAWFHAVVFGGGYVADIILSIIIQSIVQSINPDYLNQESALFVDGLAIVTSVRYSLLFLILMAVIFPNILTLLKKFADYKNILIGIAMGIGVIVATILYNFIVSIYVELEVNTNESYVELFIKNYPYLAIVFVGILGPIVEEFIYRYGLFEAINKNKKLKVLAYIVTILVFAFIHFDFTGDMKTELLNIPAYIIAAFLLTFTYDRFGFGASVMAHITNNMYAIIMTLLFK